MADYTYEIAWWPATDAVKQDLNAYKPAVEVIAKHTSLPMFIGISVEKQDFFMFVTWKNTAAHNAFIAHPDRPALVRNHPSLFPSDGVSSMTVYHTHLNADPSSILEAPLIEHTFLTPREGVSTDELKGTLLKAHKKLEEHKDVCLGAVMGGIEERPDQVVVLVGWKSLEAHQAYIAPGGPAEEVTAEIRDKIKEYAMFHVPYTLQT